MPKDLEEALRHKANQLARRGELRRKKGETMEEAKDRFVYGNPTMIKWRKKNGR